MTDELGDPTRDERDSCVLDRYIVVYRVEDVREVTEREEEGSVKELPGNREGRVSRDSHQSRGSTHACEWFE